MRFKIDENLPRDVADLLRSSGYDATTVPEEQIGGAPDSQVFAVCQQERRVLVTLDLDFANVRAYPPAATPGILVLRLTRQDRAHVVAVLRDLLPLMGDESPQGRLWIVEEHRLRIRE